MLTIRMPDNRKPERQYAVDVLVSEFLGLEFRVVFESREDACIAVSYTHLTLPTNYSV